MKSELGPICFNCQHWSLEATALDTKHQGIVRKIAPGTEIPPSYGKCRAWYLNPAGEEVRYNDGTRSDTLCQAKDFEGHPLFSPVPEG